jgi:prepilin-type N-terminal cleavage/methylation domain-containing protein
MKRLPGFTLIEVAIVLVIVGILSAAIFKGRDVLDGAKIRSVAQDFQRYQLAISMYQDQNNALPGDDTNASTRYGADVPNGNRNHVIEPAENENVWLHLYKGGFITQHGIPSSKLGGIFSVVSNPTAEMQGNWLKLSNPGDAGLLTPKQAQQLKAKFEECNLKPGEGNLRITNGSDATCLTGDSYSNTTAPACVAYYKVQ